MIYHSKQRHRKNLNSSKVLFLSKVTQNRHPWVCIMETEPRVSDQIELENVDKNGCMHSIVKDREAWSPAAQGTAESDMID